MDSKAKEFWTEAYETELLDKFAAAALTGLLALQLSEERPIDEDMARESWSLAEAMMSERKRRQKSRESSPGSAGKE